MNKYTVFYITINIITVSLLIFGSYDIGYRNGYKKANTEFNELSTSMKKEYEFDKLKAIRTGIKLGEISKTINQIDDNK